jgi:hypothetical protein
MGAFEAGEAPSFVVTTDQDVVDSHDALTSLREAILLANSNADANEITFGDGSASGGTNFLDATPQTITLGGTELPTITAALTIIGSGAANLTINANNLSRIFNLDNGSTGIQTPVELVAMTLTGGNAGNGGAIFSRESLTLRDSVVTGNSATPGGGIYSRNYGTTTIQNSTLSGNSASSAAGRGGGIFVCQACFVSRRCKFSAGRDERNR